MKRKSILIGFQYRNGKKLPGITVDLYQVYCFLKKFGWKDNEIVIYTDIKKDSKTEVLKTAILEKLVDSSILSFIEDIKERNQYIEFTSHNYHNNFENIFLQHTQINNLFVYYTGHCENGNLILPNQSLLSLEIFSKLVCNCESDINKEILCIMDCCNGGINLPFSCHEEIYRFQSDNFVKPKVISIAAALQYENSVTSRTGSFFTKNIFSVLQNPEQTVFQIVEKTKYVNFKNNQNNKQTVNISASYPILYHIFPWFYSFPSIYISRTPYFLEISRN